MPANNTQIISNALFTKPKNAPKYEKLNALQIAATKVEILIFTYLIIHSYWRVIASRRLKKEIIPK